MGKLDGKVAWVTGGGTGIGLAIVEAFVAAGAKVFASGRRKPPLEALTRRFPEAVATTQADVSQAGEPQRAVALALARLGRLDILVNNAGVFRRKPLVETTDEDLTELLAVNLRGTLACVREALPHLAAAKGCIINISSEAGVYARPGLVAYGATKAAVNHATRSLAAELGPMGIRVNAVAPGLTRTDMTAAIFGDAERLRYFTSNTALGRVGEPADIARVVLFLASDDAAWVTGQRISATGGLFL